MGCGGDDVKSMFHTNVHHTHTHTHKHHLLIFQTLTVGVAQTTVFEFLCHA